MFISKMTPITEAAARAYKGFIAALGSEQGAGCVVCGAKPCQVAHYRGGEPCSMCNGSAGRQVSGAPDSSWDGWWMCGPCEGTGWQHKKAPAVKHDHFTLPLCPECHLNGPEAQHSTNERLWWAARQIDPLALMHQLQGVWDTRKSFADAIERGTALVLEVRNGR